MKIVLNLPTLSCGGAERVAVLLSKGMEALGHDVWVSAFLAEGEFRDRFLASTSVVDLGHRKPVRGTAALAKLVRDVKADAVIAFGMHTGIAAAISKLHRGWKCPLIIRNEINLEEEWRHASAINRVIGPPLSRWAAQRARLIVVSGGLSKPTADYLGIEPSRLTTILNPVFDPDRRLEGGDDSLHPWLSDRSVPTFVAVGRLEHQKGFDVLIDAIARVRFATAARLVVFGNGSLRGRLQARIQSNGLADSVALAGYTDNPVAQMRAAHAFVLSSRFEGFGLVLVEALSTGTRVIATDCDYGPAEILEGGRYGTLVPVEDVAALAHAMLSSINRPPAVERPPPAWFEKFGAVEAARQHVSLIQSARSW